MSPRADSPNENNSADLNGGQCTSCGSSVDELVAVHRVYITPAAWDSDERVDVMAEVERWCFPCRTHYPHQLVDE